VVIRVPLGQIRYQAAPRSPTAGSQRTSRFLVGVSRSDSDVYTGWRGGFVRWYPACIGIARYGQPEEIAELMAFLVTPGARWMTGSTLRMDGGEVKSI
jgi:NAD(P)-dependent dehydrogenase (short-subunit alcohol dehydrogenase family)